MPNFTNVLKQTPKKPQRNTNLMYSERIYSIVSSLGNPKATIWNIPPLSLNLNIPYLFTYIIRHNIHMYQSATPNKFLIIPILSILQLLWKEILLSRQYHTTILNPTANGNAVKTQTFLKFISKVCIIQCTHIHKYMHIGATV